MALAQNDHLAKVRAMRMRRDGWGGNGVWLAAGEQELELGAQSGWKTDFQNITSDAATVQPEQAFSDDTGGDNFEMLPPEESDSCQDPTIGDVLAGWKAGFKAHEKEKGKGKGQREREKERNAPTVANR
jgi:hypothetical protein